MLLGYGLVGVLCYSVMAGMGEMAAWLPLASGFTGFATRFVDPALGFATGWTYWFEVSTSITLLRISFNKPLVYRHNPKQSHCIYSHHTILVRQAGIWWTGFKSRYLCCHNSGRHHCYKLFRRRSFWRIRILVKFLEGTHYAWTYYFHIHYGGFRWTSSKSSWIQALERSWCFCAIRSELVLQALILEQVTDKQSSWWVRKISWLLECLVLGSILLSWSWTRGSDCWRSPEPTQSRPKSSQADLFPNCLLLYYPDFPFGIEYSIQLTSPTLCQQRRRPNSFSKRKPLRGGSHPRRIQSNPWSHQRLSSCLHILGCQLRLVHLNTFPLFSSNRRKCTQNLRKNKRPRCSNLCSRCLVLFSFVGIHIGGRWCLCYVPILRFARYHFRNPNLGINSHLTHLLRPSTSSSSCPGYGISLRVTIWNKRLLHLTYIRTCHPPL